MRVIRREEGKSGRGISIPSQRHQFFFLGRSFSLVIRDGESVKTFRLGDEEGFLSRIGRVPVVDVDGILGVSFIGRCRSPLIMG